MESINRIAVAGMLLLAFGFSEGSAQSCAIAESVRAMTPRVAPPTRGYRPLEVTGPDVESALAVPLGVGHVYYSPSNPVSDRPPGEDDWLRRVELPLSEAPGEAPSMWLVDGWLLRSDGAPEPLSTRGLIETGYEELSFVVLELRSDGWLRIRYAEGEGEVEGEVGTAWTPRCALREGPVQLDVAEWRDWFLTRFRSGAISPLFFRSPEPGGLRSGLSPDSNPMAAIADDYILEPLEVKGEWMRVTVKEPSDYCEVEPGVASREGWIRWYDAEVGPLVWYYTRGC